MKTNCEYCGAVINDYDETCSNCGAVNAHYKKVSNEQPKTIEELQQWYIDKNLPPENVTRFFIGKDVKQPKAFGIYKDEESNTYIVYKNKADGTRAVRYDGGDEAYAVNEIFQKLRETMAQQKAHNVAKKNNKGKSSKGPSRPRKRKGLETGEKVALGLVGSLIIGYGVLSNIYPDRGSEAYFKKHPQYNQYYEYHNDYYYNLDGDYYLFDEDDGDWEYYGDEAPFNEEKYERYLLSDDYYDYGITDFEDTSYYDNWYDEVLSENNRNHGDDDDDDDWDSGWDSGDDWDSDYGSDWDSDW